MIGTHPQNRRLGYARVSTYGQMLDTQLEQLRAEGCTKIFRERVTGARADRRELLKLLKGLAPGDVVTVTRIDRLARSTFDLFAIVKQIVERDPIRTRTAEGRSRAQKRGEHYGPAPEIDGGAEGRGPPTTGAGRDAR